MPMILLCVYRACCVAHRHGRLVGRARVVTFIKRQQIFFYAELFWVFCSSFLFFILLSDMYIYVHLMQRIISSFPRRPHWKCYSITFVSEFNQARKGNTHTRPFSLCLPSAVVDVVVGDAEDDGVFLVALTHTQGKKSSIIAPSRPSRLYIYLLYIYPQSALVVEYLCSAVMMYNVADRPTDREKNKKGGRPKEFRLWSEEKKPRGPHPWSYIKRRKK